MFLTQLRQSEVQIKSPHKALLGAELKAHNDSELSTKAIRLIDKHGIDHYADQIEHKVIEVNYGS